MKKDLDLNTGASFTIIKWAYEIAVSYLPLKFHHVAFKKILPVSSSFNSLESFIIFKHNNSFADQGKNIQLENHKIKKLQYIEATLEVNVFIVQGEVWTSIWWMMLVL